MDNNNGNGNKNLKDKEKLINDLKQQINDTENEQIGQPSILKTNNYKYQIHHHHNDESHSTVAKFRRYFAPLRAWIYRNHFKWQDSSRIRRQWVGGGMIFIAILMIFIGVFYTKGLRVVNTPINSNKVFVNGDTVRITKEEYDPHTQMALAYLTTGSQSSTISPNDLSASFRFADKPKTYHVPTPTIQLLPIYQNHFVVVMKNVYPGYHGISIKLLDHNRITASELGGSLKDNNGTPPGSQEFDSPHMGALYIGQKGQELASASPTGLNATYTEEQDKLLNKVQKNNTQYLVLSASKLGQNQTHISRIQSGREILNKIFVSSAINNQRDIKLRRKLIKQDQKTIAFDHKRIKSLYKRSNLSDNNASVDNVQKEISNLQQEISTYKSQINADASALSQAQDRWNQLNNGTMKLPKPSPQDSAEQWGGGKE